MTIFDSRTSRVLLTALMFALGLGLVYAARRTLILFLFAIFFAYLINPGVLRLEKLVRSRGWSITIIYLLLVVALAIFGFLVGPRIARQSARLGESLPLLMDKASSGQFSGQIGQFTERISSEHGWSEPTQTRIKEFLIAHRDSPVAPGAAHRNSRRRGRTGSVGAVSCPHPGHFFSPRWR